MRQRNLAISPLIHRVQHQTRAVKPSHPRPHRQAPPIGRTIDVTPTPLVPVTILSESSIQDLLGRTSSVPGVRRTTSTPLILTVRPERRPSSPLRRLTPTTKTSMSPVQGQDGARGHGGSVGVGVVVGVCLVPELLGLVDGAGGGSLDFLDGGVDLVAAEVALGVPDVGLALEAAVSVCPEVEDRRLVGGVHHGGDHIWVVGVSCPPVGKALLKDSDGVVVGS